MLQGVPRLVSSLVNQLSLETAEDADINSLMQPPSSMREQDISRALVTSDTWEKGSFFTERGEGCAGRRVEKCIA